MESIMSRVSLLVAPFLVVVAFCACAPVQATVSTLKAKDSMFKAELAGANEVKPGQKYVTSAQYEYYLAYLYIEKSKELQGFSKFDSATFYANRAASLGNKARDHKAEEEKRLIRRQQIRAGQILPKEHL